MSTHDGGHVGCRYVLTAAEREDRVISAMAAAHAAGRGLEHLGRWVRAWKIVARAYDRECKHCDAKRARTVAVDLQRADRRSGLTRAIS